MLVRWICGCVGFDDVKTYGGRNLILRPCNGGHMVWTTMGNILDPAAVSPLTAKDIVHEINSLLSDGEALRTIRSLLGVQR